MPLSQPVKYRVRTTEKGHKIRLALRDGHVVEAKNLGNGALHSLEEFKADKKPPKGSRIKHALMRTEHHLHLIAE